MNNLRKFREKVGITQDELAKLSGCARSYIGEVETGKQKMTLKLANRIAPFLHCSVADVLGGDAIKYNQSFSDTCKAVINEYFGFYASNDEDSLSDDDRVLYEMLQCLFDGSLTKDQIKTIHSLTMTMEKANLKDKE